MTAPVATHVFEADLLALRDLGGWLDEQLPSLGCTPEVIERVAEIELAVHEIAVNTIEHANTNEIRIELRWHSDLLHVICLDSGREFDLCEWPAVPTEPQVGGYGLMIVEQLTSSLSYARTDDGQNAWRMTFAGRAS